MPDSPMQECSPFGQTKTKKAKGRLHKTHESGAAGMAHQEAPVFIFL